MHRFYGLVYAIRLISKTWPAMLIVLELVVAERSILMFTFNFAKTTTTSKLRGAFLNTDMPKSLDRVFVRFSLNVQIAR